MMKPLSKSLSVLWSLSKYTCLS